MLAKCATMETKTVKNKDVENAVQNLKPNETIFDKQNDKNFTLNVYDTYVRLVGMIEKTMTDSKNQNTTISYVVPSMLITLLKESGMIREDVYELLMLLSVPPTVQNYGDLAKKYDEQIKLIDEKTKKIKLSKG